MFLQEDELDNVIYGYQLDQITEGNDTIILEAINTAIEEVKSYLTRNNKKDWLDGRIVYDVESIFSAEGSNRNPLLLAHTKTVAKWYIVELCNADIIYEHAKERYDRSVKWLDKLAQGEVTIGNLPTIEDQDTTDTNQREPFQYGSRKKFNHE